MPDLRNLMRFSNASMAGGRLPAPHRQRPSLSAHLTGGVGKQGRRPVPIQEVSSNTMPIRVRVPTPLRRFTGGNDEVTAEGDSIKAVIEDLERRHPGLRERLLDDNGELRRFVNIYLNGDDIRFLNQLTSKVKD